MAVIGQSHCFVLHFEHTIPPTNSTNDEPYIALHLIASDTRPISLAIAVAVTILSPVTILTVIPALWHSLIASGTYALGVSLTPTTAISTRLFFSTSYNPLLSLV